MAGPAVGLRGAQGPPVTTFATGTPSPGRSAPVRRTALENQVQGYLDHLAIERGVAANTLISYRRDLRRYIEHLMTRAVVDLRDVSETDVSDFLVALRRGDARGAARPVALY